MQIGFDVTAQFAPVVAIFAALLALPCTIVITLALIRRFRGRVAHSMRATVASPQPEPRKRLPGRPLGELQIERIDATRARARAARAVPLVADTRRRAWQLAAVHAAAAGLYPLLLAVAMMIRFSPSNRVVLVLALLYATFVLELATPVALAPAMVLRRQPRSLLLGVLGLLAVLGVWDSRLGVDSIGFWLMTGATPTVAILLLNTRRLRAVGPIVFAATLLLLFGLTAGLVYADLYGLDVIGPLHFVRADLAGLPLITAVQRYFTWLRGLPLEQAVAEISALIDHPTGVIRPENADRLTAGVEVGLFAIWLAGTAVGAAAAWGLVRWLARSYRAQRASDQMLSIDVLVLIVAAPMFLVNLTLFDPLIVVGVLAGLGGYKLVSKWGLRRQRAAAPAPHSLLLLRVFGFDRRTQRLLEDLGQRWRYLGPIRLIGGPDLADTTLEPHEFFDFLSGRLSRAFVKNRDDLERRLAESTATPDPDGRFRIEDFFCHDDTWRMTVCRLAGNASAVLMDLRGFTVANRGCIFEIEELIAAVAVDRIVLLVDGSTDLPFLERTLTQAWGAMPGDSPNAVAGQHQLRILQASPRHGSTLANLLGLLCARSSPCAAQIRGADLFIDGGATKTIL